MSSRVDCANTVLRTLQPLLRPWAEERQLLDRTAYRYNNQHRRADFFRALQRLTRRVSQANLTIAARALTEIVSAPETAPLSPAAQQGIARLYDGSRAALVSIVAAAQPVFGQMAHVFFLPLMLSLTGCYARLAAIYTRVLVAALPLAPLLGPSLPGGPLPRRAAAAAASTAAFVASLLGSGATITYLTRASISRISGEPMRLPAQLLSTSADECNGCIDYTDAFLLPLSAPVPAAARAAAAAFAAASDTASVSAAVMGGNAKAHSGGSSASAVTAAAASLASSKAAAVAAKNGTQRPIPAAALAALAASAATAPPPPRPRARETAPGVSASVAAAAATTLAAKAKKSASVAAAAARAYMSDDQVEPQVSNRKPVAPSTDAMSFFAPAPAPPRTHALSTAATEAVSAAVAEWSAPALGSSLLAAEPSSASEDEAARVRKRGPGGVAVEKKKNKVEAAAEKRPVQASFFTEEPADALPAKKKKKKAKVASSMDDLFAGL